MQSFPMEGKDVITVSCSPMNSGFELVVVFSRLLAKQVLLGCQNNPKHNRLAKSHSCNNRMGLRAGANPNFTSQD
ncbi:hypothetical protein MKW92_048621 [Papaver armeniacum]|nr:hypothetical protein MKW92_048621 [Papaver armeniacum]